METSLEEFKPIVCRQLCAWKSTKQKNWFFYNIGRQNSKLIKKSGIVQTLSHLEVQNFQVIIWGEKSSCCFWERWAWISINGLWVCLLNAFFDKFWILSRVLISKQEQNSWIWESDSSHQVKYCQWRPWLKCWTRCCWRTVRLNIEICRD